MPRAAIAPAETLEFIEDDGKRVGETEYHSDLVRYLVDALRLAARNLRRRGVKVNSDQFFYWDRLDPRMSVCPDVYYFEGLRDAARRRRTFKLWRENTTPRLVIEACSRSTIHVDLGRKKQVYQEVFRASEYLLFDPEADAIPEGLLAYRLVRGRYRRAPGRELRSRVLEGHTFRPDESWLWVVEPSGAVIPLAMAGIQRARYEGHEAGRQEGIEKGRAEGIEKGRVEGLEKGRAELVLGLLRRRFGGPLPEDVEARILALRSPEDIEPAAMVLAEPLGPPALLERVRVALAVGSPGTRSGPPSARTAGSAARPRPPA